MLIWTITTAFSGVFQPLLWLDNASGSITEQRLVWTLLALSIAGMAGNVSGPRALPGCCEVYSFSVEVPAGVCLW